MRLRDWFREKMTTSVAKPLPDAPPPAPTAPVVQDDDVIQDEQEFLRQASERLGWIQRQADARIAWLQAQADAKVERARQYDT